MDEIERRKRFIKDQVGDDTLDALREQGLDVEAGLNAVIGAQVEEEGQRALEREIPITSNMMISELVYNSKSMDDMYGREFAERLRRIELDDDSIRGLYQEESSIISRGRDKFGREQPWTGRYFFMQGTKIEDLPEPDDLTLSELILITDDASSAHARDHHWLSPETWAAVCVAAVQTNPTYAYAMKDRVAQLGWSRPQEDALVTNESLLTERLKWGHHKNPAWTTETTNMDQYKQ